MSSPRLGALVAQAFIKNINRKFPLRPITHLCVCGRWTKLNQSLVSSHHHHYTTEAIPAADIQGQDKSYSPKIQSLVDEISQLTLIEVADLNDLLKKTLNITDAPMMPMGAMMGAQAPKEDVEEEAEAKQEKTFFAVKLTGFEDTKKVNLIKQIKSLVEGMNLVQAKKFVESTPQKVQGELTKQEAEDLKKSLEEAGGKAEIE